MAGILILAAVILAAAVIVHQKKWIVLHNSCSMGIRNHNSTLTEFWYLVDLDPEEILNRLEKEDPEDRICYEFRREQTRIRFYSPLTAAYSPCSYQLTLEPRDGRTLLTVRQLNQLPNGRYPYLQNEFWMRKLQAVPTVK